VIGATGYAGALSAALLWRHPAIELAAITSRSDVGRRLDDLYPRHRVPLALEELDLDRHAGVDAAIVAYPHGAAAPTVAALRERGVRVLDLSADFRLSDPDTYAQYYGEHGAPELFGTAVYGLPELYRDELPGADLVAGPGCYPTAALLGLRPLAGVIDGPVIIDAKSGVTGAGRSATDATHFVTVNEDLKPYKVGTHRHRPEIEEQLAHRVTFQPHLVPMSSGELTTCYVSVTDADEAVALLADAYSEEPFVELLDRPPGVLEVRETNDCRLFAHADGDQLIVFAAIDNLWKGTASQAVQSLNLMFGRPETEGLV
jgi:N-acetyl-gamma-glutamyl-phosphate reductase